MNKKQRKRKEKRARAKGHEQTEAIFLGDREDKSKLPGHIQDTKFQDHRPTPKKRLIRTLEWVIGIVSLIITILGFFLSYGPKLSVGVSGSLRTYDPMGTVFYLSNDGVLPVHDLTVRCFMNDLEGEGDIRIHGIAVMVEPDYRAAILSPGHKMTLPCAHAATVGPTTTKAQMNILVDYRPDFLFWYKHAQFPMEAEKTQTGEWIWKNLPR